MVDWSKLPDIGAVTLLACAFASVARHNHTPASKLWLTAWAMIAFHFIASMFLPVTGIWGTVMLFFTLSSLTWAGELFMWAAVPYRQQKSSSTMVVLLIAVNTLYIGLLVAGPAFEWALTPVAVLFCLCPLAITLFALPGFNHILRWTTVLLRSSLAVFLLVVQHRPDDGGDLALNAILFTVFFGCALHFLYMYRRATAGAFITIAGFVAWAGVFVVAPVLGMLWPQVKIESEVWNLPKYVVAVGMILLLLENQIEHNKYLALHDELTGLPNRRLFQDRLASALERARRTGTQTALLLVDLNRFKQVNDTLGHHAGDLLLQHVATVFAGRVRRSDTVARTGGDEFSLILEEPTNREEANRVGQSLMQLLAEPLSLDGHVVRVGASVGISIFPEDALDMESLCIAADRRMYSEKQSTAALRERAAESIADASALPEPQPRTGLQTAQ
ncbi:MAG: GGDEF domain-containing protein [Terracidiphilus sp.]